MLCWRDSEVYWDPKQVMDAMDCTLFALLSQAVSVLQLGTLDPTKVTTSPYKVSSCFPTVRDTVPLLQYSDDNYKYCKGGTCLRVP